MNILVINYMETTAAGGINVVVSQVGEHLAKRGHVVTVLQPNPLNLQSQETYRGFHIIRLKSTILLRRFYEMNLRLLFSLRSSLALLRPDVVHVHGYHTLFSLQALRLLQSRNYPIVYSPHFGFESHNSFAGKHLWGVFNTFIGGHNFEIADKIICASNFESENVEHVFSVSKQRIEVVPHGVPHIRGEQNKKPRETRDCISLIYFGYLIELKGVHYALRAVSKLEHELGKHVTFAIIGEGDYKPDLVALAKKMNIEDSISWFPFLYGNQLQEKLENADIFLLLSRSENYGISVAEALSMGVPCIVAKTSALKEFLNEPGCFGIDYPPDPHALAQLIAKVHSGNAKTGSLSDKIKTWDRIAQDYERIYNEVASTPKN
jgi:glycogen(starch) synthase